MTALFTDFDGVLFDSLPEAYRLGRAAHRGTDVHAPADAQEFARFSALRFLVTHSAQYWRLFRLIDIHGTDAPEALYRAGFAELARDRGNDEAMRAFDEKFLALRKKLIAEEHAFWLSLSTPYPFLEALRPRFRGAFPPVIVTTKNRAAVLENLAAEGIRGIPEKILDKADCARAGGKRALIAEYMENNAVARGVFVDDVLANIRECEPLPRLRCLHAGWGYCDPLEKGLTLEEILKQIETS